MFIFCLPVASMKEKNKFCLLSFLSGNFVYCFFYPVIKVLIIFNYLDIIFK